MATNPTESPVAGTEAGAIAAIIERFSRPAVHNLGNVKVPVVIDGKTGNVTSLERLLDAPHRTRARVTIDDYQSFIAYVAKFKEPGTILFAQLEETGGTFTAIVDYHLGVADVKQTGQQAQWGNHSCVLTCFFSPEWTRWDKMDGQKVRQGTMAQFIEDNMLDILEPAPSEMLEMVKTLEATQGVQFKSFVRLDNGDRQLAYAVTTGAKAGENGDIVIPQKFKLRIPIFVNGPAYEVTCRFRYNIDGGTLSMWFEIERPHLVINLALVDTKNAIATALALPVLTGEANVPAP